MEGASEVELSAELEGVAEMMESDGSIPVASSGALVVSMSVELSRELGGYISVELDGSLEVVTLLEFHEALKGLISVETDGGSEGISVYLNGILDGSIVVGSGVVMEIARNVKHLWHECTLGRHYSKRGRAGSFPFCQSEVIVLEIT